MRWKIETFFKSLKSGCKAEESKPRTAERIVNLLAAFCILSWRNFWLKCHRRHLSYMWPNSLCGARLAGACIRSAWVEPSAT